MGEMRWLDDWNVMTLPLHSFLGHDFFILDTVQLKYIIWAQYQVWIQPLLEPEPPKRFRFKYSTEPDPWTSGSKSGLNQVQKVWEPDCDQSISVFPRSSHCDTIMFSIISTAYQTVQQVKQRPMNSWSQCSGLWADLGDFLLSFVCSMCYSSQITQLCCLPLITIFDASWCSFWFDFTLSLYISLVSSRLEEEEPTRQNSFNSSQIQLDSPILDSCK